MSGRRKRAQTTDSVKGKSDGAAPKRPPKPKSRAKSADSVAGKDAGSSDLVSAGGDTVKVVVRMRPFNTKEKNEKRGPCITLDFDTQGVAIVDVTMDPPRVLDLELQGGETLYSLGLWPVAQLRVRTAAAASAASAAERRALSKDGWVVL